jgi:ataxin-3
VDLADIARQLDEEEGKIHVGIEKSGNFDDTGFFSIQVISKALQTWDLELVPLRSERMKRGELDIW